LEAIGSEAGPETMISDTFWIVGFEKSTFSSRSGVTVMLAATMSPFPPRSSSPSSVRRTGIKTTWIRRFSVLYFWLMESSNSLNASAVMPRGVPLSMK
jgi:hypothetical protein